MMEGKRLSNTLPEELVEMIVSMMPFPAILKARGISKSWLAKFSPVSRHEEEEKKQSAVTFQKLVREQSTKWRIFFPVRRDNDVFSFCEWQRQQWIRIPLPFLLRPKIAPASELLSYVLGIEGTLWYCVKRDFDFPFHYFYVGNIFTRLWKKLPARPLLPKDSNADSCRHARLSPILVRDTSLETYKLFVLFGFESEYMFNRWYVQIYESTLDSWSTKKLVEGVARLHRGGHPYGSPVYFNGVLYTCAQEFTDEHLNNVIYLTTFNIEKESFEELALPVNRPRERTGAPVVDLVVCCAKLMMIVTWPNCNTPIFTSPETALLNVLTVDVGSRQLLEVARAPYTVDIQKAYGVCSDGKWIFYMGMEDPIAICIIAYNVQEDEWAYMDLPVPIGTAYAHWCKSAVFQPGLNPFAEV